MLDARIPLMAQGLNLEPQANALARAMQMQGQQQGNALRQMQMQQMQAAAQQQMAEREAAAQKRAQMDAALRGLQPVRGVDANRASGIAGPRPGAAAAIGQRPAVDPIALLRAGFDPKLVEFIINSPNLGRAEVARVLEQAGPDGRPQSVQIDKFGQPVGAALPKAVEAKVMDLGGTKQAYDPYGLKAGQTFQTTMTPGQIQSDATTRRGQNMTDARTRERMAFDMGTATADAGGPNQAAFTKTFGKATAGYRWKADGSQEAIPGGPADRKTNEQLAGKETVDTVVASLRNSYDALNTGGGITSTQKGPLDNLAAATSRTAVGQTVGGAFGTRNQKERDAIAQARPLLLQAIMKATGMSAKQMDSNAELKLYLATATDPTLTLEANREALDRIEQLYGSGALNVKPEKPARTVKRTGTSNGRKVVEYTDGSIEYAD